MSIGKSSITKRVAKTSSSEVASEKNIAPELVATVAAAPQKTPAKKTASSAKKTASPKNKTVTEKITPPTEKKVDTAVIANIAPETVAAVIGHEEQNDSKKVQIGEKMPVHLL